MTNSDAYFAEWIKRNPPPDPQALVASTALFRDPPRPAHWAGGTFENFLPQLTATAELIARWCN
jgi:hypothetical protein